MDVQGPLLELLDREFSPEGMRRLLGVVGDQIPSQVLAHALQQPLRSVFARRGKGFRGRLVATSYALAGGRDPIAKELPVLLEILHAGSLVVDDIEDDSDSRRGAPSLHVIYGTPAALNAGNWLYFWALALVERLAIPEATQLRILRRMSRAMLACHFGQALDLSVAVDQLARPDVPLVVRAATQLKTGRLMQLAAEIGALAAGGDDAQVSALAAFGCRLGTGLQMLDDWGGLTSPNRRHKGFEDLRLGRMTWPWAWAAEQASDVDFARLRDLARKVRVGRAPAERVAAGLVGIIEPSARGRVHRHLADALDELARVLGPSDPLLTLKLEIARLERSYD